MYKFIEKKHLSLDKQVPRDYMEMIYDCIIQLSMALDFAHSSGLVHGNLDLSHVWVSEANDHRTFKITDFQPGSSMELPISSEANYWPFARNKKNISEREKLEVLMLKDIYSLGICLLELMIGRSNKNKYSISLDSVPVTWSEPAESTPLIQVLVECIQIDSIS